MKTAMRMRRRTWTRRRLGGDIALRAGGRRRRWRGRRHGGRRALSILCPRGGSLWRPRALQ